MKDAKEGRYKGCQVRENIILWKYLCTTKLIYIYHVYNRENYVHITLWPAKAHLIGDKTIQGDIIAITSALVTEFDRELTANTLRLLASCYFQNILYNIRYYKLHVNSLMLQTLTDKKQLESNYPTEIFVNPTFPNVQEHFHRLKELAPAATTVLQNNVTLHKLLSNSSISGTSQFTCTAQSKEILAYRNWYYVRCSMCNNKSELERGESTYYVCKDHDDTKPRFMYCVNASLTDSTDTTKVAFFNNFMTDMMGTSCKDMVILHGHTDQKIVPPKTLSNIGVPVIFNLTLKPNRSIIVTKVTKINQHIPTSATLNTSSAALWVTNIT
ncbi:uncharacterized protein LOC143539771 isoform X1 [Bidens hawaiensis]|uniref:uncharacterized protein LOC143539771 isoform X1 n=1 Tax=Bidens hawaiensis TaxID=980011 RepID=UPI004049956E